MCMWEALIHSIWQRDLKGKGARDIKDQSIVGSWNKYEPMYVKNWQLVIDQPNEVVKLPI